MIQKVAVDEKLVRELDRVRDEAELVDFEGRKLGYFVPAKERAGDHVRPPAIADPKEQTAVLARIVERMKINPIPSDSPRFSRDELHERR